MEEFILRIGEKKHVKLGFLSYLQIAYCGMSSKEVFSVGYMENKGYQGYGINLFFPKSMSKIKLGKSEFRVLGVSPEKLTLSLIQ